MVQKSDFEGCSGCLPLLIAPFIVSALIKRGKQAMLHHQLVSMTQRFVFQEDRSAELVSNIQKFCFEHFHNVEVYDDLAVVAAAFIPDGKPPFLDEKALAAEFRRFLKMPMEDEGAWPPAPTNLRD